MSSTNSPTHVTRGKCWASQDGGAGGCPHSVSPPSEMAMAAPSTAAANCSLAQAIIERLLDQQVEIEALKRERAAEARLWAETVFAKEADHG